MACRAAPTHHSTVAWDLKGIGQRGEGLRRGAYKPAPPKPTTSFSSAFRRPIPRRSAACASPSSPSPRAPLPVRCSQGSRPGAAAAAGAAAGASGSATIPAQHHQQSSHSTSSSTSASTSVSAAAAPSSSSAFSSSSPAHHHAASSSSGSSRCPFSGLMSAADAHMGSLEGGSLLGHEELDGRSADHSRRIPGPDPWDVVANVRDLSVIATSGIEEATLAYGQKYGPICRFSNGVTAWTFVNDADIIQHICSTNARNYSQRFLPAIYEYVTGGRGILGSQGEYNRAHRKMCQPPFMKPSLLAGFSTTIADQLQELVQVWREAAAAAGRDPVQQQQQQQLESAQGSSFTGDLALHMQRFTLNIIGKVAFSNEFGQIQRIRQDPTGAASCGDAGSDALLLAVNESQQLMANVFITPLPVLRALRAMREPGMMRLDAALEAMRVVMMEVIQERRDALAANDASAPKDDLLGVLLMAKDDAGQPLSNEELWEDVHDVMGAGHETTATTTTATLFLISQHAHVEAKVMEELQRLNGRAPTFDDINAGRLAYTQMAVKETLRMYPPIPLFPRQVAESDWLPGGYHLPGGDVVFMSTYAMGRNTTYWPEPLTFNPDRFTPAEEARRPKFAWVPFGAGPRMCLGASFAVLAVTQVVATLLQNFKFEAVSPTGTQLPFAYDITMNFPGGVKMKIAPR